MSEKQSREVIEYKINETTGKRIYSIGDGLVPQIIEGDHCSCADVDCSYVRSCEVWVYPHGDRSQKFLSDFWDHGSMGISWGAQIGKIHVHMDDEWEYKGEDQGPEIWGVKGILWGIERTPSSSL